MYLLMKDDSLTVDYMFVDEAHKITSSDKRSTIYFNIVDMLSRRQSKPHIIFASPNVPNPEVYLELVPGAEFLDNNMSMKYSPVTQFVYMVDYVDYSVNVYNQHLRQYDFLVNLAENAGLRDLVKFVSDDGSGAVKQNLVYCSSKDRTVTYAQEYAKLLVPLHNPKLDALAKDLIA